MDIQVSAEGSIVKVTEDGSFTLGFDHHWPAGAAQTLAIVLYRVARAAAEGEAMNITFPTGVVETLNASQVEAS